MPCRRLRRISSLLLERQAVDLDHVVEHPREDLHHFAVLIPVELRPIGERLSDKTRQVDRPQQTRSVWRKRLFAALPRHDAIEDNCVVIRLSRIEHRLPAAV